MRDFVVPERTAEIMIDSGSIKQQVQPEQVKMATSAATQQKPSYTTSPPSSGVDRYEMLKAAREKALGSVAVGSASAMVLAVLDESTRGPNNATEATPLVGFQSTTNPESTQPIPPKATNPCEFMGESCTIM
eukprot:m.108331 g.108331  ORF g.108331 m.108331 type:complete len:132 (-) comp27864_c1_seq1:330-725(-)